MVYVLWKAEQIRIDMEDKCKMRPLCPICNNNGRVLFSSKILGKYDVQYYQCDVCALIYTEEPYWLSEAYESAIVDIDTGVMTRNIINSIKVTTILKKCFSKCSKILDYGGGYGFFARIMRDCGYDCEWYDMYAQPLVIRGFEWNRITKISCLTCFEVFEHYKDPLEEIRNLASISDNIIFSTVCYDKKKKSPPSTWWYYSQESGQHITIYSRYTLEYIAKKLEMKYYNILDIHIFTKNKLKIISRIIVLIKYYFGWSKVSWISKLGFKYATKDMNRLKQKK